MHEVEDVSKQMALLRASLGCGATLALGMLATFAAAAATIFAGPFGRDFIRPLLVPGLLAFVIAAPLVGALAVVSRRVGRALEKAPQRLFLGCSMPVVMSVVGTVGTFVLLGLSDGTPRSGRSTDLGQGIGIGLMLFCMATPVIGLLAAFFPRIGVALGVVLVLAFLGAILDTMM